MAVVQAVQDRDGMSLNLSLSGARAEELRNMSGIDVCC